MRRPALRHRELPPGQLSPAASPPHSHRWPHDQDDIDTIESAVNVALARQSAAFDKRVTVLETRAEIFAASLGLLQIAAESDGMRARVKELQGNPRQVAARSSRSRRRAPGL